MTRYNSGYNFERRVLAHFRKRSDFIYAMRSGGSKGLVDLLIILRGYILLVQSKKAGYLSKAELQGLVELRDKCKWSDDLMFIVVEQQKNHQKTTLLFRSLNGEVLDSF